MQASAPRTWKSRRRWRGQLKVLGSSQLALQAPAACLLRKRRGARCWDQTYPDTAMSAQKAKFKKKKKKGQEEGVPVNLPRMG